MSYETSFSHLTNGDQDGCASKKIPPFGREMRKEFLLDPTLVSLDHGAYGTYPKHVRKALHVFQDRAEANSNLWMRREAMTEMQKVRQQLADFVNASVDDIVMVANDTNGQNAVLRSLKFNPGEQILHLSVIYNSMQSLIQYVHDSSGGTVTPIQLDLTFPVTNDEIIAKLEAFLKENHRPDKPIRLALIDHISSTPAIVMPVDRIIPILKKHNILVLVDGAHAIGQIPIDLKKLAPDFYTTNCHKWMYTARGSALLYVDKKHQSKIHAANIASGYATPTNFQFEFFWTGTIDYSMYMTVTAALEFRRMVGGEKAIRDYTHGLAVKGGNYLAKRFGTEVLQIEEEQIGSMVNVRLPIDNPEDAQLTQDFWIDTLLYRFPQVFCTNLKHGGKWYIRVSCQIYNDFIDIVVAANTYLTICHEINRNFTK